MRLNKFKFLVQNYWFIPGAFALAGIVLGLLVGPLDHWLEIERRLEDMALKAITPTGARVVLSTIAASMITVGGVTFSITIVAIANVTGQFGARVVSNFMDDRDNQLILGIFLGNFGFCLVILAMVRAAGEGDSATPFVPQLGVLVAVLWSLAAMGAFIYFIHHTAESLRIQTQIDRIGKDLWTDITDLAEYTPMRRAEPGLDWTGAEEYYAEQMGYVRSIDYARLLQLARQHGAVLELTVGPGDFVDRDRLIARAIPAGPPRTDLDAAFSISAMRNALQDLTYHFDELVEIATRALSPGVNDPFTAGNCANYIATGLAALSRRRLGERLVYDASGQLRLIRRTTDFETVARQTLQQMRPYFTTDRNALLQLLRALCRAHAQIEGEDHRDLIREEAEALVASGESVLLPEDHTPVQERLAMLRAPDKRAAPRAELEQDTTPRAG